MLSKKAKYAIKALLALADPERGQPVRIADLAREEQIPPKFLELILLGLKNHGVLQSRKGKGGGYLLARVCALRRLPQRSRVRGAPGDEAGARCDLPGAGRDQRGRSPRPDGVCGAGPASRARAGGVAANRVDPTTIPHPQ